MGRVRIWRKRQYIKGGERFMLKTRVNELLGIRYPILQGGMAWISGWAMAAAVSKAGGLGTIASATMEPEELADSISKVRKETGNPFAVNIPLRLPSSKKAAEIALAEAVPAVVLSAGDPAPYASGFRDKGTKVLQVIFNLNMLKRCHEIGVDAIIAMGMEGGGNISPAELSTFILAREAAKNTHLPVVAAGGIGDAQGLVAALALGAEGIQMGTRFLATEEGTLHAKYKDAIVRASDTDTVITGRTTGLQFRVLKNRLAAEILHMEKEGRSREEIDALTIGSLKKAALTGDTEMGSLMMGQVAGMIRHIVPVKELLDKMVTEASEVIKNLGNVLQR
jgi:enoyl-[acyl-carrier protein] reductase II